MSCARYQSKTRKEKKIQCIFFGDGTGDMKRWRVAGLVDEPRTFNTIEGVGWAIVAGRDFEASRREFRGFFQGLTSGDCESCGGFRFV